MATQYYLTCKCNRKIILEIRQAGTEVRCECGVQVIAPTFREIKSLEVVTEKNSETTPGEWSRLCGFAIILLFVAVVIGAGGGYRYSQLYSEKERTLSEYQASATERINAMPDGHAWVFWRQSIKAFEAVGVQKLQDPGLEFAKSENSKSRVAIYILAVTSGLFGLVSLVCFLFSRRKKT